MICAIAVRVARVASGVRGYGGDMGVALCVSLIIDQASLADFPSGAVLGSTTCWRAVKLCGRRFEFDETGVVSAMFAGSSAACACHGERAA